MPVLSKTPVVIKTRVSRSMPVFPTRGQNPTRAFLTPVRSMREFPTPVRWDRSRGMA